MLLALSFPVEAQQPGKTPRIGFLRMGSPPDPFVEAKAQAICAFVSLKAGIQNSPGLVDELKGHVATVWLALRPQTDIKGHKRINMEGCDV